jgi:hypothetical protein
VTLLAATAAALAVWALAVPAAGLDLTAGSGPAAATVGPGSVVGVTLLAGGAGWALLAFLDRRLRHGRRVWRIAASAVLALSLLGPLSVGASGGVLLTLMAMHLAAGTTIILGLAPVADRDGS